MMKILIFFVLLTTQAMAQELSTDAELPVKVRIGGQADFFFELDHLPTSVQGNTRFNFGLLQLSPQLYVSDHLSLNLRFVLAEERSTSTKNDLNELQNAFISYQDSRFQSLTHELGLIRPLWLREEGKANDFNLFGSSSWSLARRYGFIPEGDLGYQGRWKGTENWQFVSGFANGEENQEDEQGPHKQIFLGSFYQVKDFLFQLWGSYGQVDRIDSRTAEKTRILVRAQKTWGRFTLGVEGVQATDPSLDMVAQKVLEGIEFTELSQNRSITTQGVRTDLLYDLSDRQSVLVRWERLKPQISYDKSVESFEAAWIKRESRNFHWGAFYEKTQYGDRHSSQAPLKERIRLGLELLF